VATSPFGFHSVVVCCFKVQSALILILKNPLQIGAGASRTVEEDGDTQDDGHVVRRASTG
jgi:hypothetical protein